MSGHQAKLKAQRTGAASVPILLAGVCVLALALVFSACGGGSTTASSQMPTQLSPEQILAGVLAVVQGAGAAGGATGAASGEMRGPTGGRYSPRAGRDGRSGIIRR